MFRTGRNIAGIHQHKTSGAVSGLHHSGGDAGLAKQRCLLIHHDAGNGDL